MKTFAVTIYQTTAVSRRKIKAINVLDAVKQLRATSEWCYNDKDLIEWINTEDEWDVPVDDEFLSALVQEDDDIDGVYWAMLGEEIEVKFKEI
jgi:hypothetical protein